MELVKDNNPDLYKLIKNYIHSAPDPLPASLRLQYNDQWNEDTAWKRLLHELQSISLVQDDTKLLEDIQDASLENKKELRKILTNFMETYPMLWWTLSITAPVQRRKLNVALGKIDDINKTNINKSLIVYIRDIHTANKLRVIAGDKKLEQSLSKVIEKHQVGLIYWALSDLNSIKDDPWQTSIIYAFQHHEDDEALMPLVELEPKINIINILNNLDTVIFENRTGSSFIRFLEHLLVNYLKDSDNTFEMFLQIFWVDSSKNLFLDPGVLERLLKVYISLNLNIDKTGNIMNYFINFSNLWHMLIPYLSTQDIPNIQEITIRAYNLSFKDKTIAHAYRDAYYALLMKKDINKVIIVFNNNLEALKWILIDLPVERIHTIINGSYFIPLIIVEYIIKEKLPLIEEKEMAKILKDKVILRTKIPQIKEDAKLYLEFIKKHLASDEKIILHIYNNYPLFRDNQNDSTMTKAEIITLYMELYQPDFDLFGEETLIKIIQIKIDGYKLFKELNFPSKYIIEYISRNGINNIPVDIVKESLYNQKVNQSTRMTHILEISGITGLSISAISQYTKSKMKNCIFSLEDYKALIDYIEDYDWNTILENLIKYIIYNPDIKYIVYDNIINIISSLLKKGADPSLREASLVLIFISRLQSHSYPAKDKIIQILKLLLTPRVMAIIPENVKEIIKSYK